MKIKRASRIASWFSTTNPGDRSQPKCIRTAGTQRCVLLIGYGVPRVRYLLVRFFLVIETPWRNDDFETTHLRFLVALLPGCKVLDRVIDYVG